METDDKPILRGIYAITILLFSILSLTKMDPGPIVVGVLSCVLVFYSHLIVKKYFPEGDRYVLIISAFITQFGLVMLYRINYFYAFRQIIWFTVGIGAYISLVLFLPEISKLAKYKYFFIIIAIILLASPLIHGIGSEKNGSRNWLTFGKIGVQPSELAKLFIIFYLASSIQEIKKFLDFVKTSVPVYVALGFLIIEKDLGSALIFFGIYIAMLYIGTSNLEYVLLSIAVFALGAVGSYMAFAHIRIRFYIWHDPWKYKYSQGRQICQSLFAIANGGIFGTGLGLGHPEFIPEVHNDCIFAAICEEFGMLGAMALILLYLLLIYRGLRIAIHARTNYSRLVAVGISSMICFQVFVIIGGVIKMIPLTGITLPFVSYGGTSMLLNYMCLGVLQKISECGDM